MTGFRVGFRVRVHNLVQKELKLNLKFKNLAKPYFYPFLSLPFSLIMYNVLILLRGCQRGGTSTKQEKLFVEDLEQDIGKEEYLIHCLDINIIVG